LVGRHDDSLTLPTDCADARGESVTQQQLASPRVQLRGHAVHELRVPGAVPAHEALPAQRVLGVAQRALARYSPRQGRGRAVCIPRDALQPLAVQRAAVREDPRRGIRLIASDCQWMVGCGRVSARNACSGRTRTRGGRRALVSERSVIFDTRGTFLEARRGACVLWVDPSAGASSFRTNALNANP